MLTELKTTDDAEFHQWAVANLAKNPSLILAYKNLRECWDTYHSPKK